MSEPPIRLASSPCLMGETADDLDSVQSVEVARWRRAERAALLQARAALTVADRQVLSQLLGVAVLDLITARFADMYGKVVAAYWPIQSEPDLRPVLATLIARGARAALPEVVQPKTPLVFRPWAPGAAMRRGHWNIPVPDTDQTLIPDIVLAPLVGWDEAGYRLGYGGGYFDRTLAVMHPFAIGTGLQQARLATIFPQPHDIAMDVIVTDCGLQRIG